MITIANVIEKFLAASPGIRGNQRSVLTRQQKEPIGKHNAPKLTPHQVVAYFTARAQEVSPATVAGEVSFLKGALEYAEIGLGIEGVSAAAIYKALPILRRQRLVGASNKRSRIPSPDETQRILAHVGPGVKADVIEFQNESARRISETCRLQWGDLDAEKKSILVRDMKHPRMKSGHSKRLALPDPAFAIIMRQPRLTTLPDERIFKVRAGTVELAYRRACAALEIEDLHLHDSRRGCLTRLIAAGKTVPQAMLVSGHLTPTMVLTVYNGLQAEDFHK